MGVSQKAKLISFDPYKLGKGLSSAKSAFKALEKDGKILFYFCDVGGGGAFTPMVASAAATYIREGIEGIRQISGLGGLPALETSTIRRKGNDRFHYWTGAFAASITYGIGTGGRRSTSYITFKEGGIKKGNATYAALARWLEHGTPRIPPRPVIELSLHDFVAKKLPVLLHETKRVIAREMRKNHKNKISSTASDINALASAKTFGQLDLYRQDFKSSYGKGIARRILNKAGFMSARLDKW